MVTLRRMLLQMTTCMHLSQQQIEVVSITLSSARMLTMLFLSCEIGCLSGGGTSHVKAGSLTPFVLLFKPVRTWSIYMLEICTFVLNLRLAVASK